MECRPLEYVDCSKAIVKSWHLQRTVAVTKGLEVVEDFSGWFSDGF